MSKLSDFSRHGDRWLFLAGALVVAALFSAALYLQYALHQDPCPLCMIQRMIFVAIGLLFLLAAIHQPTGWPKRIYGISLITLAATGVAVASRHIWIQHLPKDEVPACGPGLEFMLQHFPLADVWQELMHGSGECAEKGWTLFSLGIPEWSLLAYGVLGAWAGYVAFRARKPD